jgi:histone acetyltransferase 1
VDENDGPACKKMKANPMEQLPIRGSQMDDRMDINDILQRLSVAVPPITSVHVNGGRFDGWNSTMKKDNKTMHSQYLDQPIGRIVKSYLRKINKSKAEAKFVITIAEGTEKEASHYQESIQKLARWFIETADDVDLSGNADNREDGGGYWSVLYLFREHSASHREDNDTADIVRYSLAGYITLFHFHAPFKKPEPGIVLRVCQALIFPPYQRAGHGSDMLQSVYEYAEKYAPEGSKIVEVNVEDPAPRFIALRNCVDYSRFSKLVAATPGHTDGRPGVTDKDFF